MARSLAFGSCAPPKTMTNGYLTVGTPDANGAPANSVGSLVQALVADVRFTVDVTDIRCLPAMSQSPCNSPNAADGPDYSGNMQLNATGQLERRWYPPHGPHERTRSERIRDAGGSAVSHGRQLREYSVDRSGGNVALPIRPQTRLSPVRSGRTSE